MSSLSKTTVVVTGGGSGIGRAVALGAAAQGARVAVVDRSGEAAAAVVSAIVAEGGDGLGIACDVADDGAVGEAMQQIGERLGRVQGLVTSAGIFHGPDFQPVEQIGIDDFMHVLGVNLGGTFSAVRHAMPMLRDGGGAIVTIASTAAIRGHGHGAGYTASKGAVDAFTRLLAVQGGPDGVRANCICPGGVDTPMTGGVFATEDAQRVARREIPIGRYAQPGDIADVALFLLGDGARYVTGQTLPVEGGATIA